MSDGASLQRDLGHSTEKPSQRLFLRLVEKFNHVACTSVERVRTVLRLIEQPVVRWLQSFAHASPRNRWTMVRIPLFLVAAAVLIAKFGSNFLPPNIATTFPGHESIEAPLDSTIEVIFDRRMIRSLVERSFTITPEVPGSMSWEGDQKLIFTPRDPFSRATRYTVRFHSLALSRFFTPLRGNRSVTFDTIGNPKVILASPQTEALEYLAPITVVFDRPMIPLTTVTNTEVKQSAFSVSPEIPGEGRWLGTTAYQFRPSERYRRATTYTVTVPAGLGSQDGGVLQSDFAWEFSSERPRVEAVSPVRDEDFSSPVASASAILNQPIEPSSVADRFSLFDKNKTKVPGRVIVSGKTVGFYPHKPLTREERYDAVISQGIASTEGSNGMETEYTWSFGVAAVPAVVSTGPADGDQDVSQEHYIEIEFKTPMDEKSFQDNVFISPAPERKPSLNFSSYKNRNSLTIGTYLGRSTKYTVTIGQNVKDQYGIPLGKPYTFSFKTAPYKPSLTIFPSGTYFGAFNQNVTPRIVAQVRNANEVQYSLYRLAREDLLDLYRRRYMDQCGSDYACRNWQNYDPGKLVKVRDWSETYAADFNTPIHVITKVTLPSGENITPGFYFLNARIPQGVHDNMVMIVTKSTLTIKRSEKQILVWGVNQSSGEVVPGMKMELVDSAGTVLSDGETNADGVFLKDVDLFGKNNLLIFGQSGEDVVVAADSWNSGIARYDFGLPSYYNPQESKDYRVKQDYKLYVTLDRPIYRPGHHVYFKGIVRKDNDGAYENLSPGENVHVTISDAMNRSVYTQDLSITTYGSFSSDVILSEDANLGYYQMSVVFQGNTYTQQFQVEEYRKPDLAVEVVPSKDAYLQGDAASVTIHAAYYFGAPVVDAPVTWTLETQDDSFRWDEDWRFEFGDPDSYWSNRWWEYSESSYFSGKKVTEGKGRTNGKGDLQLSLPLDISKQKTGQRMVIEAVVNDDNNQSIAASKEFTVHKGELYAGLRPTSYANQVGKDARVEIVTVDLNKKRTTGIPVAVEFYKRTWETVREKNPDDGLFYYTSKPSDTLVASASVTTDSFGRAIASFTPTEGGTYKVVGKVTDKTGNTTTSGSFLWVSGVGFSTARENHDRIVLVTDKRDYVVGENLSVFVASPYSSEPAKTLLTAERGSVLEYRVVETSDTSNNFSLSIPGAFAPNVFIGAVLIRPGAEVKKPAEFKIGYTEVKVTDKKQQIEVRITTDKKKYKPQETLFATIETRDLLGHPVSTELAVGLVDKAVWDLSQVEFPDIYKTFYQPRNLEVTNAQLLTISIDRINANTNLGAKGGSGGGGGEGGFDTSRRDFPDTAYWNPHVVTNQEGKSELAIPLPDSLTTWRLAAIANSAASAFGESLAEVVVSRDILIRPFLPRFLSIGDEAKLGAIIVNTSGEPQTLTATIDTEGLAVTDQRAKTQSLAPGAQTKIVWQTKTENVSTVKINLSVLGANASLQDAIEMTLPVVSYSVPEVVATSGEAKDTAEESIVLPKEVDLTQGKADVSFSPSLGGESVNALPYLLDYPYYCTEQITSRFLPAVFVHRILENAKIDTGGSLDRTQLADVINDGIQRLNNQQHPDGGWGWWTEYQSDPFMTTYALQGLWEAKNDSFAVADQTLERAQQYLELQLAGGQKTIPLNTQAYMVYVLTNKNTQMFSYAANLYDRRFELSIEARAYLAMAMKDMPGMKSRADRLLGELVSFAKKTATTTHWEESKRDYRFMGSNTTTTASVLEVLVMFDKKNPLIPEVIRYLMSIRRDGRWTTTRDTASAIKAIASQLLIQGDQKVNENYRLEVNGKILKEGVFTKDDLLKLEKYALSIAQLTIGQENQLRITKSGTGNLYYSINLKYYLPFSEIEPLEQGIVVVREFVNGKGKILPAGSIDENTEVWVRLIIVAPEERHFVVIEDVLPAGLESVNESLKNVSVLNTERPDVKEKGNQLLYFEHKEYHDDRTTLFANHLPPGVYELTYRARATTPGRYHHPPAQAYQMYVPDVSGHSEGGWLEVKQQP